LQEACRGTDDARFGGPYNVLARATSCRQSSTQRRLDILELDAELLDAAAVMQPATLRTLHTIHLAAAVTLGDDLEAIVTYDRRMTEGASSLGLPVASPGTYLSTIAATTKAKQRRPAHP
jgi:predicted nucleic acid-binding protein